MRIFAAIILVGIVVVTFLLLFAATLKSRCPVLVRGTGYLAGESFSKTYSNCELAVRQEYGNRTLNPTLHGRHNGLPVGAID